MTIIPLTKKLMFDLWGLECYQFGSEPKHTKAWPLDSPEYNLSEYLKQFRADFLETYTGTEQGIQSALLDIGSLGLETICFSSALIPWGRKNVVPNPL